MKITESLRSIIYLRRIARSLDKLIKVQQGILDAELRRNPPPRANPRPMEISVASVSDWNENYHKAHPDYSVEEDQ